MRLIDIVKTPLKCTETTDRNKYWRPLALYTTINVCVHPCRFQRARLRFCQEDRQYFTRCFKTDSRDLILFISLFHRSIR